MTSAEGPRADEVGDPPRERGAGEKMLPVRLRQLEYFVAVAESGSFRKAAEKLYVAQPSLSLQISQLEEEVGGPLLHRHSRGVWLTPAGRLFLHEARTTLAAADRALRRSRLALSGDAGEIRFATVLSIASGLVPRALSEWRVNRPEVRATIQEYRHAMELERSAAIGEQDFAIGPRPTGSFPTLESVGSEEFVVVLPRDDDALAESSVDLATIASRPWVLFGHEHGLSATIESIFARHGLYVAGAVFTSQTDVAVNLAIAGLGPTIVPENVIPIGLEAYCRPMRDPFIRELFVYSLNPISSLAEGFLDHFRRVTATDR